MSSDLISLSDFVYPVPICQSEADLGSIISIFQHLNCKCLAIPQEHSNWGIIYAEDLIGLLAAVWKGETTTLIGHPRNITAQQAANPIKTLALQSIIKPALIYAAEMELWQFLQHTACDSLFDGKDEYLIVDVAGELKGKLDQTKIIQFLARKSPKLPQTTQPLATGMSCLKRVVDSIALPIKIETAAGQEIYQNKCWGQLVNNHSTAIVPACQKTPLQTTEGKLGYHLPHTGNYLPLITSELELSSEIHNSGIQADTALQDSESKKHPRKTQQQAASSLNSSWSSRKEESTFVWHYLQIPLRSELSPGEAIELDSYCLKIAIKVASVKYCPATKSYSTIPDAVTNKLLATVSHELKSPLTGIVGLSNLLNEQKLGQLNQHQARYAQLIHRSGQKMMHIIEDLLQLTRLSVEYQEPELINLELLCRQVYQDAVTRVWGDKKQVDNSSTAANNLKLDIELGSEITVANSALLSSVLLHLVLEVIQVYGSESRLEVDIGNLSGLTVIAISFHLRGLDSTWSSDTMLNSAGHASGLNLTIAEYWATLLEGNIKTIYAQDRGQFTLLLPKNNQQQHRAAQNSPAIAATQQDDKNHNLTILCLYPELEAIAPVNSNTNSSHFNLKSWSDNNEQQSNYQHRIIEADSLEQAHTLARIWRFDVIILDSYQLLAPAKYLHSLLKSEYLAALPLITLDAKTTEAANKIEGLNIYPCLLPAQDCSVQDLMQVIEIATGK